MVLIVFFFESTFDLESLQSSLRVHHHSQNKIEHLFILIDLSRRHARTQLVDSCMQFILATSAFAAIPSVEGKQFARAVH
jgi:hypothetical protein